MKEFEIKDLLKKKGLKITKGRIEVIKILNNLNKAASVEYIYSKMNRESCRSIATTYRIANQLADVNILRKTLQENGISYYEMNRKKHIHYIVCTSCGEIEPLYSCPIAPLEKKVADNTGYKVTGHNVTLKGLCPNCLKKELLQNS